MPARRFTRVGLVVSVVAAIVVSVIVSADPASPGRARESGGRVAANAAPSTGPGSSRFGDFNGDGLADVVVVGPSDGTDDVGDRVVHSVLVVLGTRSPRDIDMRSAAASAVVRVHSALPIDGLSSIGDFDGDGLADVLVTQAVGDDGSGGTYVVFGRRGDTGVDVERGPGVLRVPNADAFTTPIGDLNGDGADELWFARRERDRSLAVIYGRRDRARITAATIRSPGSRGFVIDLGPWRDGVGAVSTGDADGDGLGDLALLLENYTTCFDCDGQGTRPFVVFGRRRPRAVEIRGSYGAGFTVRSRVGHRQAGYTTAHTVGYGGGSPGDFNGDGRDDLFMPGFESGIGTVVIEGPPRSRPAHAPTVVRVRPTDSFSDGFGALGDVNGDGLGDVLVATDSPTGLGVVFGRRGRQAIDPRHAADGIRRVLVPRGEEALTVGRAGDVNGDRIDDLVVPLAATAEETPEVTYVVFGSRAGIPPRLDDLGAGGFAIR